MGLQDIYTDYITSIINNSHSKDIFTKSSTLYLTIRELAFLKRSICFSDKTIFDDKMKDKIISMYRFLINVSFLVFIMNYIKDIYNYSKKSGDKFATDELDFFKRIVKKVLGNFNTLSLKLFHGVELQYQYILPFINNVELKNVMDIVSFDDNGELSFIKFIKSFGNHNLKQKISTEGAIDYDWLNSSYLNDIKDKTKEQIRKSVGVESFVESLKEKVDYDMLKDERKVSMESLIGLTLLKNNYPKIQNNSKVKENIRYIKEKIINSK